MRDGEGNGQGKPYGFPARGPAVALLGAVSQFDYATASRFGYAQDDTGGFVRCSSVDRGLRTVREACPYRGG